MTAPSPSTARQPAVFIGHGVPLNALEENEWTRQWAALGASLPERPRAVLAVSAHWYIGATAVTAMSAPRTIHDFYGFPRELNEFEYPAAGAPELVDEVADVVKPTWVGADQDSWGLDHGTWSVLTHVFPDADVPVAQLSVDASKPAGYHFDLGTRLAALRDSGVLVLASGNVVHNLAAVDPSLGDAGTDWAHRFDDHARELLTTRPEDALALTEHPDARLAVPTADHFLPLLYTAGMAAGSGETLDAFTRGYAWGSVSMTSYRSAA
ncbi:4,5-DOPA dioxygenase extradiol [Dietzia kunjamensis subsp. schimae]|uniref:4,5-DOPA dioxygenase extradiol n=1 Tax=Dietzia kunjamensis subsp. schimae TaxID=498198 RepID=A0ABY1N152_9ACTN|nr:4,5-DOPA dioxygenase extradiol [Dietzia kunjamensis]SMO53433.1 4,5-DOPA dioxygenase extradiol [Dietzia kunjamensis subsp. schimae]